MNDKKYFSAQGDAAGRLNADDAPFSIGQNEWVNRVNCRIGSTDKGYTGNDESIGGTIKKGAKNIFYTFMGSVTDTVSRNIIQFYKHNVTPDSDKIMVYSFDDDTDYTCVFGYQVTGGLNFNADYPIHSLEVVGDIVYWTDNYNQPKKINYKAGIKLNHPSYDTDVVAYTAPIEAGVLHIIREPPFCSPSISKITQPTILVNNVADFAGQFAWRYIFRDGEVSVLSPISTFVNYNRSFQTENTIRIVAVDITGTPVHINQDVQQVDFCVRYGNSGSFFVINSWNKNIAAQAAQIANHNANIAALSYNFYNDKIGIALDQAYSVKPFDSVPLYSETLSVALSRLHLCNNTESFDSPILSSLTYSLDSVTNNNDALVFKNGADYRIGILFRDRFKRVIGNVFTNESMRVQIPDRTYSYSTYIRSIIWDIIGGVTAPAEIPVDAYYYEIVMTKNLRTRFFVEARGRIKYAIKNATTGEITYQHLYSSTAFGVALSLTQLTSEGLGYQYDAASGDIARICRASTAGIVSLKVKAQDANYAIVDLYDFGPASGNFIFEIYTPYKEIGNDPFFTVGKTYAINNPTESNRDYSATGVYLTGDTYLYTRSADNGDPYRAENMAVINKYWKEWLGNWGEVNIYLPSKQVVKQTADRWSNVLVEGTDTNGMSSFDALDEKILPMDLGAVRKLQLTSKVQEQGNVMLAIGEQGTASLYLGEVQVVDADRNAFLASSPNVIGTVNVLKGDFGTTMPTSVIEYRGNVWWVDINNGRVIQYSTNGLFPISNFKMTRFWKNWCIKFLSLTSAEIEALGSRPFIYSAVDPSHDELLFSIPKLSAIPPKGYMPDYPSMIYPFDILDYQDKTMVYDLKESRWMGSYEFTPQGFSILQNELFSYNNGQLYLHNQYDRQCYFYDTQYTAKIMFVSNVGAGLPKVYNNITTQSNLVPTFVYFYNYYPVQQSSDLVDFSFRNIEGNFVANILRNKLVPTETGFNTNGLLTGEVMRNIAMFVMIEFSPTGSNVMQLKFVDIGLKESIGNTTIKV